MSSELITMMIEENCIDHGHYELETVHTDNLVRNDFVFNYKLGDILNSKIYSIVKEIDFDTIVTYDTVGMVIAYPISLMMKKSLKSNHVKDNMGEVIIITSIITSLAALNELLITESVKSIICITNYSGIKHINGIDIIEVVPVNTWLPSECPYCKDETNE